MSQSDSKKVCPACGQEGQFVTCTSGNKSEVVFYHPQKPFRTICHIAGNENAEAKAGERVDETA